MTELDGAIALAMQTARTEALIEAEQAVRDRIDKLSMIQLSEARSLNLAADDIAKLPRLV